MFTENIKTCEKYRNKEGSQVSLLLDLKNAPVKNHTLVECFLPKGLVYPYHYHKEAEESYYVIEGEGEGEIVVDGENKVVKNGDIILIPRNTRHGITAYTDMKIIATCAPTRKIEDVFYE